MSSILNLKRSAKAILFWALAGFAAVVIVLGVAVKSVGPQPQRCHLGFVEEYHGLWGWDYVIDKGMKVPCEQRCMKPVEEEV